MKFADLLFDTYFQKNKSEFLKILSYVFKLDLWWIYSANFEVSEEDYKLIKNYYDKFSIEKIPLDYVLNEVDFFWNKFYVNENVLIPRPETEYLVKYALDILSKDTDFKVFDIWTGSWIIWISIANYWYDVVCSDISNKALEVAKKNYKNIQPDGKIEFLLSNLWEHLKKYSWKKLICANLPYVPEDFKIDEYAQKEPSLALFASNNGVELYENLLDHIDKQDLFLFELTLDQANYLLVNYKITWEVLNTCHKNIKILKWKKTLD